ncbi:MAG: hypothetical protein KKA31_00445, partial [Candidatus Margulisbacteria bacterium]|nr:hypothetical protein [Candidatus Margulisiibacteriota bacterium]
MLSFVRFLKQSAMVKETVKFKRTRRQKIAALFIFIGVVCLVAGVAAAIPQEMSYQGKLTDSGGSPVTGTYSIVFTIYDAESGGSSQWTETKSVSVETGLFNVMLGSTSPISSEVFATGEVWLGVKVGADSEMSPRKKLVTSAYAFNADTLDGHDWTEIPPDG